MINQHRSKAMNTITMNTNKVQNPGNTRNPVGFSSIILNTNKISCELIVELI